MLIEQNWAYPKHCTSKTVSDFINSLITNSDRASPKEVASHSKSCIKQQQSERRKKWISLWNELRVTCQHLLVHSMYITRIQHSCKSTTGTILQINIQVYITKPKNVVYTNLVYKAVMPAYFDKVSILIKILKWLTSL